MAISSSQKQQKQWSTHIPNSSRIDTMNVEGVGTSGTAAQTVTGARTAAGSAAEAEAGTGVLMTIMKQLKVAAGAETRRTAEEAAGGTANGAAAAAGIGVIAREANAAAAGTDTVAAAAAAVARNTGEETVAGPRTKGVAGVQSRP